MLRKKNMSHGITFRGDKILYYLPHVLFCYCFPTDLIYLSHPRRYSTYIERT